MASDKNDSLQSWLRAHNSKENVTLACMSGGSYSVVQDEFSKLCDLVYTHVHVQKKPCHLVEQPVKHTNSCSPLLIDFDLIFPFTDEYKERSFVDEDIFSSLRPYILEVAKYLVLEQKDCFFYIMQSKLPYKKKTDKGYRWKDGVHIMFPNIVCPRHVQLKIRESIFKKVSQPFVDLGCGDGRSIFFFNKQLKINFNGIEYDPYVYGNCKKLFNKYDNIEINHGDIMSFKFLEYNNDCFFIGNPLKKKYDFDKLIQKILEKNMKNRKKIYFIVVNVDENKREVFNKYKLIDSLRKNNKGYYIYSNEKINENSANKKS